MYDEEAGVMIASASASSNGPSPIHLWRWTPKDRTNKDQNDGSWSAVRIMEFIVKVVVIVAAVAYIKELFRHEVS